MNEPKRHHYIPKMIQRRFANSDGNLFVFDKHRPNDGVVSISPTNLFVEKHIYSMKEKSGKKNPELEKRLSCLEGLAHEVIKKVELAAQRRQPPYLPKKDKEAWDLYFYVQWKRTPDSFERSNAMIDFDTFFQNSIVEFESLHRLLTEDERDDLKKAKVQNSIKHNARVATVGAGSAEVMQQLGRKGLAVLKIENDKKNFILGSSPIVKFANPDRTHISNPTVEIWFPITPKLAVSPAYSRGVERLIPICDGSDIGYINMAVAEQSTVIAGSHKNLIESLAYPK